MPSDHGEKRIVVLVVRAEYREGLSGFRSHVDYLDRLKRLHNQPGNLWPQLFAMMDISASQLPVQVRGQEAFSLHWQNLKKEELFDGPQVHRSFVEEESDG